MQLKRYNYINISNVIKTFNNKNNLIYLIVHQSDLNIMQNNLLQTYFINNNIVSVNVKSKLFKKLTKNELILNLFVGPTKIYIFTNLEKFFEFKEKVPFSKKIIPLAVYYDNNIYSFSVFFNEVNKLKLKNQSIMNKEFIKISLISNLMRSSQLLIKGLTLNFSIFIKFLSYLKINKQN